MKDTRAQVSRRAEPRGSLLHNVVEFCRVLSANGIPVAAGQSEIACRALAHIDLSNRATFRSSLRICLLHQPEHFSLFHDLFEGYWRFGVSSEKPLETSPDRASRSSLSEHGPSEDDAAEASMRGSVAPDDLRDEDGLGDARFSEAARTGASVSREESEPLVASEFDRLARSLSRELAQRRSRRKQAHRRGRYFDSRAVLRSSVRYGGFPLELSWRRARIDRAQLVLLLDVSRSMSADAQLLLQFAAAVMRRAWRVEVFLFANRLERLTHRWPDRAYADLLARCEAAGGGTQIGASLTTFLSDYGFCLRGNKCTTLILSDGLDAGEPDLVGRAMEQIQRRSRRVVWLNPLIDTSGYEPTARGMAAALPFIDIFSSAGGIDALWRLIRELRTAA